VSAVESAADIAPQSSAPAAVADAPEPDESLLSPAMAARLARLGLMARRLPEARRRGRRRTRRIGAGIESIDTRPYELGDDPRRIAWSAYARLERLLVRVVADESPLRLVLVVDSSASMAFGQPSKIVQAARIAAGLAAVSLVPFGGCSNQISDKSIKIVEADRLSRTVARRL